MKHALAFNLLSPVRQEIVLILKKRGPRDMEALAQELFLSVGAVRQNLAALAAQGVVRYTVERSGPGRPRHIFQLSPNGQCIFPDFYGEVADALLTALEDVAPESTPQVYSRIADLMFEGLSSRLEGKQGEARIRELVKALDEAGYLPEVRRPDPASAEVTIFHCPLYLLVLRHPETCDAELRCLKLAVGSADVSRPVHRVAGDGVCAFVFRQN